MGTGELNAGGSPVWRCPIQGGVEILLVASCYRNRDKLCPGGPLGPYADFLKRKWCIPGSLCLLTMAGFFVKS